jgi:alpha-L-rhamnosidase
MATGLQIARLRCEHLENPIGLDIPRPRLGWTLEAGGRGARQTAYQILVASNPEALAQEQGDLWDSGKVASDQSVDVAYGGRPLASGERAWWAVKIWDGDGQPSAYSEPAF